MLIKSVIIKYSLKNMVSYLCKIAEVSRSGYYNYFSESGRKSRENRAKLDEVIKENVLDAYKFKGRKKGARQIKIDPKGSVRNNI
jgi:putative transposase